MRSAHGVHVASGKEQSHVERHHSRDLYDLFRFSRSPLAYEPEILSTGPFARRSPKGLSRNNYTKCRGIERMLSLEWWTKGTSVGASA
jgi:hypothetical protein